MGIIVWSVILLLSPSLILDGNAQSSENHKVGVASYYHNKFVGKKTANGEVFSQSLYTCASNHYPLGSYLKITNLANKRVVYVKVNDRMGHQSRLVDLTYLAAKDLSFVKSGITKVKIETVPMHEGKRQVLAQLNGDQADITPSNVGNQL